MKYWLLFISSCLYISVYAQEETDSTAMVNQPIATEEIELADSIAVPKKRVFQPQLYVDFGKLITTSVGLENKLEGAISLLFFEKFEVITEFGKATLNPEYAYINGNYQSSGTYFRFGGGMMGEINAKSNIGLGVRYGISKFSDQGLIEINSPSQLQDDFRYPFSRSDLSARWWSAVLTSESRIIFDKTKPESKINHLVKIGFFFKMRFLVTYENEIDPVEVYSIPGYGSAGDKQQAVINVFLKFTP
ncbi:MAG: hypothetical protein ACJA08_000658 [Cyclobacteriaceae bacterium]|jgi:hypothetical protein